MTIQITGKNIGAGDAFKSFVEERLQQVLGKYALIKGEPAGHVRIEKERSNFLTDCAIQLRSGLMLRTHGEADDAYASAEAAFERLDKRLRRYKRRLTNHHHQTRMDNPLAETPAAEYTVQPGDSEDQAPDEHSPIIIAETQMTIRELPVSDAVMQMDLSNQPFLVFRNASHGGINIVYQRPDGNIGWIDPQQAKQGQD